MGEPLDRLLATLAGAPAPRRWTWLCQLMDCTPAEEQEAALPALLAALDAASWPHALRPLPRRWLRALIGGQDVPAAALARTLVFHDQGVQSEDLRLALHHPRLTELRGLVLRLRRSDTWGYSPALTAGAILQRTILGAPQREALEELDLSRELLEPAQLTALLRDNLPALRRLTLHQSFWSDQNPLNLLSGCVLPHLQHLTLASDNLFSFNAEPLDLPALPALTGLTLAYIDLSAALLDALGQALHHPLERLTLGLVGGTPQTGLGAGLVRFLNAPALTALRRLELPSLNIERTTAEALAQLPALDTLEHLELSRGYANTTPRAARALSAAIAAAPNLRTLHMEDYPIEPTLLGAIASLQHLEELSLTNALNHLDALGPLQRLRRLDLTRWRQEEGDAYALIKRSDVCNLEHLTLAHLTLTEDPLKHLTTTPTLARLRTLRLVPNHYAHSLGWDEAGAILNASSLSALEGLELGFSREVKALKRRERPLREAALQRSLGLSVWAGDHAEDDACADLLKPPKPRAQRSKAAPAAPPDPAQRLELLRDLLYQEPDPARWTALLDLLTEDHPDAALRREYAAPLLDQRWPDHLRVVSNRLAWTLEPDAPAHPALALCRTWDDRGIERLFSRPELLLHPGLANLTGLHLGWSPAPGQALDQALWSPNLHTLSISLDPHEVPDEGDDLLAAFARATLPALKTLTLRGVSQRDTASPEQLAQAPWWRGLRNLTLSSAWLGEEVWQRLGSGELCPQLATLQIYHASLDGTRSLREWPAAATLTELSLSYSYGLLIDALLTPPCDLPQLRTLHLNNCNDPDAELLEALMRCTLPALEKLELIYTLHPDAGLDELMDWQGIAGLRSLTITDPTNTTALVTAIGRSPRLQRLEHLQLLYHLQPGDLRLLLAPGALPALRTLHAPLLEGCAAELADAPHAERLERLHLTVDSTQTLGGLTARADWPALRALSVSGNIGPEGADHLARWPTLARLETLTLYQGWIGDDGLRILLASPHLGRLRRLNLNYNSIGRPGIEALTRCEALGQLHELRLASNNLGSNEARLLAAATNLSNLQLLDLAENGALRIAGIRALLNAPTLPALGELLLHPSLRAQLTEADRRASRPRLSLSDLTALEPTQEPF